MTFLPGQSGKPAGRAHPAIRRCAAPRNDRLKCGPPTVIACRSLLIQPNGRTSIPSNVTHFRGGRMVQPTLTSTAALRLGTAERAPRQIAPPA